MDGLIDNCCERERKRERERERQTDRQTDRTGTGQDRTGQGRAGQGRTGQDRTGQTEREGERGRETLLKRGCQGRKANSCLCPATLDLKG